MPISSPPLLCNISPVRAAVFGSVSVEVCAVAGPNAGLVRVKVNSKQKFYLLRKTLTLNTRNSNQKSYQGH